MVLLLGLASNSSAQPFTALEIGRLPGATSAVAMDINNRTQVVGVSGVDAFIWEPGTGIRPLGFQANTILINNSGVIAAMRLIGNLSQLLAMVEGTVYELPGPPGETLWSLHALTDNNILMVCGSRCWALYAGLWYDLTALTGASSDPSARWGL